MGCHYLLSDRPSERWAWGVGYRPRLGDLGVPCDVCGNGELFPGVYPEQPLGIIVEDGSAYPDCLGCGGGPLLIVSQAVTEDWEEHEVTGWRKFPMTVKSARGEAISLLRPPQYYHIQVLGRCELDLAAMQVELVYRCPKCEYRRFRQLHPDRLIAQHPFVIVEGSWDETDLFQSDLYPGVYFCTARVLELARSRGHTGFGFYRPESRHEADRGLVWESQEQPPAE
jgi:DNA-directed RNA polymerase subunit RPC12/RpoP